MADTLIISWDQLGLECIYNVSESERQQVFDILANNDAGHYGKGKSHTLKSLLNYLVLRATYNPQRHYEIYAIEIEEGISADDVKEMFENNPQHSADLVRSKGRKLYSDRLDNTIVKIT